MCLKEYESRSNILERHVISNSFCLYFFWLTSKNDSALFRGVDKQGTQNICAREAMLRCNDRCLSVFAKCIRLFEFEYVLQLVSSLRQ